jgi:hypothetical protein
MMTTCFSFEKHMKSTWFKKKPIIKSSHVGFRLGASLPKLSNTAKHIHDLFVICWRLMILLDICWCWYLLIWPNAKIAGYLYLLIFVNIYWYLLIFIDICLNRIVRNDLYLSIFIDFLNIYTYLLIFVDIYRYLLIVIDCDWYLLISIDIHWYLLIFTGICVYLLIFIDMCW